jgi:NADH-quinone oxidoreductase subunit N
MMAYSSVAQAGFFLAMLSSREIWYFYAVVFAAMNYVVFIVIDAREKQDRPTTFTDFAGIGYTNAFAAIAITLGLVSLTGLPPMAGFTGKLLIFSSVWDHYSTTGNVAYLALFVTGLLATVASLFFYLKIPFYAFFRRTEENQPIKITPLTNLLLLILVGLLLTLFLMPGLLMGW